MAAAVGDIYEYFNNEMFSDITIKINGEDIRAHKIVLAHASDFFKACLKGGFKESTGGVMWLYEDDTQAMKGLLRGFYGYSYEGYSMGELQDYAKNASVPNFFVALYVVGQKYLVPKVCAQAKATLKAILDRMPNIDLYSTTFSDIVQHVCVHYALEGTELRELLVSQFTEHANGVGGNEELRELFKAVPDFAFEVANAVMMMQQQQQKPKAPGKKTAASKRLKKG